MPTIYEIHDDLKAIEDLLFEIGGDISDDEVDKIVTGFMSEIETNLERKVDNYAALIKELEAKKESRKAEADRLYKLAKTDENTARNLKDRLVWALNEMGIKKLETPRFKVAVTNNGGKTPLDIHDPEAVPQELQKLIPARYEIDSDKIREALESGQEVAGAILMERGQHLRIR